MDRIEIGIHHACVNKDTMILMDQPKIALCVLRVVKNGNLIKFKFTV